MIPFIAGIQALSLSTKISIATIASAALFLGGVYLGNKMGSASCYEATIEAQRHTVETGVKQAVVSDKTVTEYVDRVQIVQGKSREIIKEVKVYVQDTCTLSGGFRLLHDSAIYNELPGPTRIADAETISVEAVAQTVIENYQACNINSETLSSLQSWVKEQSAIR
jgi:hypothetical protein